MLGPPSVTRPRDPTPEGDTRGLRPAPTSMLPPTRASSGGSGLSFSFRSCLFDCRRPGGGGGGLVRGEPPPPPSLSLPPHPKTQHPGEAWVTSEALLISFQVFATYARTEQV